MLKNTNFPNYKINKRVLELFFYRKKTLKKFILKNISTL